jgi:serine/threonine-protein kinase
MSPEQCEGNKAVDGRSDIYSLGVVMYELLTGQVPFPGDGFGAVLVAHLTQPVTPPRQIRPAIPPELEAVVLRTLEKDRNRRFQSMDEFAAAVGDPAWYGAMSQRASASMNTVVANTGRGAAISNGGPRPITTLSGAASEVSGPVPLMPRDELGGGGKSRAGLWAVLGLLVLGGAGGGFWFLRGGAPVSTTAAQPTASAPTAPAHVAAPAAPEKVTIRFLSTPAHARVTRADGTLIGSTPASVEVDRNSDGFDVAIQADGYHVAHRSVATDSNREIDVGLVAEALPPPTAPSKVAVKPALKAPPAAAAHKHEPKAPKGPKGPAHDSDGLVPVNL